MASIVSPRSILFRYIFREISIPFFICLFVLTGILFLLRSLKLFDLVINKNVNVVDMLLLFSYIIPRFLEIAIPMSLLLGIILALGRLSGLSELVVMRATGISLKQLFFPVMLFAFFTFIVTLVIGLWIRPWANHRLGVGIFAIAKLQASSGLVPGVFNKLGQLTIYAEGVEQTTADLKHVLISDQLDPAETKVFVAKRGQIRSNDLERTLTLFLYDGSIHQGKGKTYNFTHFDINKIRLEQDDLLEGGPERQGKKSNEMFLDELSNAISEFNARKDLATEKELKSISRFLVEWHRRFVIPFSCLCVAVIAMALGIQPSRGAKAWGTATNITIGSLVIISYYLILALATAIAEESTNTLWYLLWVPNLVFLIIAWFCYRRIESEKWLNVTSTLTSFLTKAGRLFERLLGLVALSPKDNNTRKEDREL